MVNASLSVDSMMSIFDVRTPASVHNFQPAVTTLASLFLELLSANLYFSLLFGQILGLLGLLGLMVNHLFTSGNSEAGGAASVPGKIDRITVENKRIEVSDMMR